MLDDSPRNETGLRVLIGSGVMTFILATVFWAGAAYQRVGAIEVRLTNIENLMVKMNGLTVIDERTQEIQKRLDKLENERQR